MNNNSLKAKFKKLQLNKLVKTFVADCIKMPMHLIVYPIQGYDDFKRENKSKGYVAWFYLIMLIVANTIAFNANGFLINKNNPKDFSLLMTTALILFPVFISVISNWASTALMDGKGSMTEIFRVISYSFFPYVWLGLISTLISNFITIDEVVFVTFFQTLGIGLTVYMMFFGLMGIHEFGVLKTISMILFTIVAIAVILFIILLFFSLFQQIWTFIESIFNEFKMRFLSWTI